MGEPWLPDAHTARRMVRCGATGFLPHHHLGVPCGDGQFLVAGTRPAGLASRRPPGTA